MIQKVMKLFFLVCVLGFSSIQAQTVTGTITDATDGSPLPGVNVIIKGTANGVSSNFDGNYSIDVKTDNAILQFSYMGYTTQEISVNGKSKINVALVQSAESLNEVVVTALGVSRERKTLSYAATSVSPAKLLEANLPNPIAAMQGKIPGVNINTGTGGPQSSSRITIRGNSSLGSNNQPLIVVDGVFVDNGVTGSNEWGSGQDFGNEMKNLNTDDFASVTVLKGGAASALYGSRAANGVIVIRTKKGRKNQGLGVKISQSTTIENAYKGPELQNEYGGGLGAEWSQNGTGEDIVDPNYYWLSYGPKFDGREVVDVDGRKIPWVAQPDNALDTYRTGVANNTYIELSGGNESSTALLSYTKNTTTGIVPTNKFGKDALNLRVTHDISDVISMNAGVKYVKTVSDNPAFQGGNSSILFRYVYGLPRHFDTNYWKDKYLDEENGGQADADDDPYDYAGLHFGFNEDNSSRTDKILIADVNLNVKISELFDLDLVASINNSDTFGEYKNRGRNDGFTGGGYGINNSTTEQRKFNFLFNYKELLLDGDLDLRASIGGESWQKTHRYQNSDTQGGLKIADLFLLSNSVKDATTSGVNRGVEKRTSSIYAFANFGWKDQLFLDVTGRNDWSSSLQYNDDHGDPSYFYPSASLAWLVSRTFEMPEWVNFGKFRASLAYTGNDANIYNTNNGLFYKSNGNYIDSEGNSIPYNDFDSDNLANLNLKNELKREFEIGAEFSLFGNRVAGDIAYYKANTTNQILSLPVPIESGAGSQEINAGDLQNSGVEIALNFFPIKKEDFSWNIGLNYSKNTNKIVKLTDGVDLKVLGWAMGRDVQTIAEVGKEYGVIRTKYAFADYQELDGSGNPISHVNNGAKVIGPDGRYIRSSSYQGQGFKDVGNLSPDFLAGFTNDIKYKNFNLGFLIDAKVGGDLLSATYNYGSFTGSTEHTLYGRDEAHGGIAYDDDGVTKYGVIPDGVFNNSGAGTIITTLDGNKENVSGMTYQEVYDKGWINPMEAKWYHLRQGSWGTGIREHAIFDNSYVALRQLTVGYTFDKKVVSKIGLTNAKVSVVGRNLFYIYSSLPDGINPEGNYNNKSETAFEYGGMPFTRSIGMSVNVQF